MFVSRPAPITYALTTKVLRSCAREALAEMHCARRLEKLLMDRYRNGIAVGSVVLNARGRKVTTFIYMCVCANVRTRRFNL